MKHVRESLREFNDYKFFSLFEEEEAGTDKETLKSKEQEALKIIDKITQDFEDFKKDSGGEILKYKEFWEGNQQAKKQFTEPGDVYKLFGSDYVVGVLELPVKTLSDGSIEGGLGATDEPEEEIIEGNEVGAKTEFFEEQSVPGTTASVPVTEAEEGDDLDLDLNLDDETPAEAPAEAPTEEPEKDLTAPQTYLVVYDLAGGEREEIFRCGSNNAVKAFTAFYNDVFKGSMKSAIADYKKQKEEEKIEAEKAEKAKKEKEKENKVKKFLGESEKVNEDGGYEEENLGREEFARQMEEDHEYMPDEEDEFDEDLTTEETPEFGDWLSEVEHNLRNNFDMEEEDAEMFIDITMDKLQELYDDGETPFDASEQISSDTEAWDELERLRGEQFEDEDEFEEEEE